MSAQKLRFTENSSWLRLCCGMWQLWQLCGVWARRAEGYCEVCIVHVVSRVSSEAKGRRKRRRRRQGGNGSLPLFAPAARHCLGGSLGKQRATLIALHTFGADWGRSKTLQNQLQTDASPSSACPMCCPIINELNLTFGSLHAPTTTTITTICIELRRKKVEVEMLQKRFEAGKGRGKEGGLKHLHLAFYIRKDAFALYT